MKKKIFKGELKAEFREKEFGDIFKAGLLALLKMLGGLFLLYCLFWMIYRPSGAFISDITVKDPFSGFEYYVEEDEVWVKGLVHSGPVKDGYLKLPESFWGKPVKTVSIGISTRYEVEIVEIPDSVTYIGRVRGDGIKEVVGGRNVTQIAGEAFKGCDGLTKVQLDCLITEIGYGVFSDCTSLKEVKLGNSVEEIGYDAFLNCTALEKVELGYGVEEIGDCAFMNCSSLKELPHTSCIEEIGTKAFEGMPWAKTEEGKKIIAAYEKKDD